MFCLTGPICDKGTKCIGVRNALNVQMYKILNLCKIAQVSYFVHFPDCNSKTELHVHVCNIKTELHVHVCNSKTELHVYVCNS